MGYIFDKEKGKLIYKENQKEFVEKTYVNNIPNIDLLNAYWFGVKDTANSYPFIKNTWQNGTPGYYYSTFEDIKNLMFETENQINLVNALYMAMCENKTFEINKFRHQFQMVFKMLGIKSNWE